jgi:hypothetical protein
LIHWAKALPHETLGSLWPTFVFVQIVSLIVMHACTIMAFVFVFFLGPFWIFNRMFFYGIKHIFCWEQCFDVKLEKCDDK